VRTKLDIYVFIPTRKSLVDNDIIDSKMVMPENHYYQITLENCYFTMKTF